MVVTLLTPPPPRAPRAKEGEEGARADVMLILVLRLTIGKIRDSYVAEFVEQQQQQQAGGHSASLLAMGLWP